MATTRAWTRTGRREQSITRCTRPVTSSVGTSCMEVNTGRWCRSRSLCESYEVGAGRFGCCTSLLHPYRGRMFSLTYSNHTSSPFSSRRCMSQKTKSPVRNCS